MAQDRGPAPAVAWPTRPTGRVILYGSQTCEDTALVRDRLDVLGIPFEEVDIDADPAAAARVIALNAGHRITPTLVAGDQPPLAEPAIGELERWLEAAGHRVVPPTATRFFGRLADYPLAARTLPRAGAEGEVVDSIGRWRGSRQVALFFGHAASCLACWGYAKQLTKLRAALEGVETAPVVVVSDAPDQAARWLHELGAGAIVFADLGGAWKRAVAEHVGADPAGTLLLVLDRYGAPRVGSSAPEAGGLVDPGAVVEWSRWLTLECPECAGEIPWPD